MNVFHLRSVLLLVYRRCRGNQPLVIEPNEDELPPPLGEDPHPAQPVVNPDDERRPLLNQQPEGPQQEPRGRYCPFL